MKFRALLTAALRLHKVRQMEANGIGYIQTHRRQTCAAYQAAELKPCRLFWPVHGQNRHHLLASRYIQNKPALG